MRTDVLARDYLRRAKSRLIDAESALGRGDYPETVRYSQECVELSLKACLRAVGVDYPKVHDVSDVLLANSSKFPSWFAKELGRVVEVSRYLAELRSPSMYGVETLGKTPSELFGRDDAARALGDARFVHEIAEKFIEEFFS